MMSPEENYSAADPEKNVADDIAESPTVEASTVAADDDNASKASSKNDTPPPSVTPTFGRIFSLITGEIPLLILAILLMLISEAGNLAVPYILARAYDALQSYFFDLGAVSTGSAVENVDDDIIQMTMSEINLWMGASLGLYALSMVFGFARGAILAVIGERLVARLRLRLYKSVLNQEIGFYDEHKTGEIVSRLGSDTQLLQMMISTFAPESLNGIMKVIMSIILMYGINAKLTSMTLGGLVVLCMIAIPFGFKLTHLSKLYQDVLGEAQTRSTEALGSIRTVQSFAAEPKELNRFKEKVGDPDATREDQLSNISEENTYSVGVKKINLSSWRIYCDFWWRLWVALLYPMVWLFLGNYRRDS